MYDGYTNLLLLSLIGSLTIFHWEEKWNASSKHYFHWEGKWKPHKYIHHSVQHLAESQSVLLSTMQSSSLILWIHLWIRPMSLHNTHCIINCTSTWIFNILYNHQVCEIATCNTISHSWPRSSSVNTTIFVLLPFNSFLRLLLFFFFLDHTSQWQLCVTMLLFTFSKFLWKEVNKHQHLSNMAD